MAHRIARRLPALLAASGVLVVGTATAHASQARAPKLLTPMYLGSLSDGRILNFQLDRVPRSIRITIDGRVAKPHRTGGIALYQAVAPKGDTKSGRSYWVLVRAVSKSGGSLRIHQRLYLHRGFTPGR